MAVTFISYRREDTAGYAARLTTPDDPIASMSTSIVSSAFDLSPAARRITLRATFNDQSVERALELE
jgi:hypothetical protein